MGKVVHSILELQPNTACALGTREPQTLPHKAVDRVPLLVHVLTSACLVLQLTTTSYKGDLCISVAGRHIGGVGIALIVAAILVVIVLAALLCYCCCCRW